MHCAFFRKTGTLILTLACLCLLAFGAPAEGAFTITDGVLTGYSGPQRAHAVIIPEGVKSIADSVFSGNEHITSVEFPASLESIGNTAFSGSGLLSVTVPADVQLGAGVFSGSKLVSAVIENGVKSIPTRTFNRCENLSNVEFPSTLERIESWSFGDCVALESIDIPNSVEFIGNSAFCGAGMIELSIPGSVKNIQQGVFSLCPNLKEVIIEEGVTSISNFSFGNCPNLRRITFPESMSEIKSAGMFADSNNLMVITFLSRNPRFTRGEDFFGDYAPIRDGIIDPTVYGYKGTQAEELAKKANLVFVPLEEEDGGMVDNEIDFGALDPVQIPTIIVRPGQDGELTYELDKNAGKKGTIVYNVHMRDTYDGKPVDLVGECILCFPYPEGLDETSLNKYRIIIHHRAGNGRTEVFKSEDGDIDFTKQGLCIRVSSFSPFEITWESGADALPQTGDHSSLLFFGACLIVSVIAWIYLKRRTRKN